MNLSGSLGQSNSCKPGGTDDTMQPVPERNAVIASRGSEWIATATGELLIVVKSNRSWDDAVWMGFIDAVLPHWEQWPTRALMVFSPPPRALTAPQRRAIQERCSHLFNRFQRAALLADSALVRAAASTLFWLRRSVGQRGDLRTFTPRDHEAAFAWLSQGCAFSSVDADAVLFELIERAGYDPGVYRSRRQ
jgi:hypothetical protein